MGLEAAFRLLAGWTGASGLEATNPLGVNASWVQPANPRTSAAGNVTVNSKKFKTRCWRPHGGAAFGWRYDVNSGHAFKTGKKKEGGMMRYMARACHRHFRDTRDLNRTTAGCRTLGMLSYRRW